MTWKCVVAYNFRVHACFYLSKDKMMLKSIQKSPDKSVADQKIALNNRALIFVIVVSITTVLIAVDDNALVSTTFINTFMSALIVAVDFDAVTLIVLH